MNDSCSLSRAIGLLELLTMDDLVKVEAVLAPNDLVAIPVGTMYHIYRATQDVSDIDGLEFQGLAVLTGAHNTLRWWRPDSASSVKGGQ
jgi:hypothetical protein